MSDILDQQGTSAWQACRQQARCFDRRQSKQILLITAKGVISWNKQASTAQPQRLCQQSCFLSSVNQGFGALQVKCAPYGVDRQALRRCPAHLMLLLLSHGAMYEGHVRASSVHVLNQ